VFDGKDLSPVLFKNATYAGKPTVALCAVSFACEKRSLACLPRQARGNKLNIRTLELNEKGGFL
jgi:hypothetical protein